MVRPGAARDPSALNTTLWPIDGVVGENTNVALGGCSGLTLTCCTDDADRPRSLVTVSVTLNVPSVANVWFTARPVPDVPSPNVQAYELITFAPSPGLLADASNMAGMLSPTGVGVTVSDAVGV